MPSQNLLTLKPHRRKAPATAVFVPSSSPALEDPVLGLTPRPRPSAPVRFWRSTELPGRTVLPYPGGHGCWCVPTVENLSLSANS